MEINEAKKKKISIIAAILYTTVIGLGMYISYYVNGISYASPELVNTLWYIEIVLTLISLFFATKYFTWKELGFIKLNRRQLVWFVPSMLLLFFMWIRFLNFLSLYAVTEVQFNLFALVGLTTLLVGFSEELMYRGIVFAAFLKEGNPKKTIFISAITFSLLHAVNIFGGLSLAGSIGQLLLTFLFGLFFGLIRLRIKNIIPLIIFHWLWDFVLIGSNVFSYDGNSILSLLFILHEFILVIVLFFLLKKKIISKK